MRRIILGALLAAAIPCGQAFAVCPSTITDCPFPIFNGVTSAANINMLDNKYLVLSTDATKQFGYDTSANAVKLTNVILQTNMGVQMPQDQPLIFNEPTSTAIEVFDSSIGRIRFKNVPVQIDQTLYMPGGNIITAGYVSVGNGISVIGAYSGTADAALSFAGATFVGGAPAIIVGDNSLLQMSTSNTGFAVASNTVSNSLNITYNGTTKLALDPSGNLTIGGQLTTGSAFQGLVTFSAGITVNGGPITSGSTTTVFTSNAVNATTGIDLSGTTYSGNTFNDGHISFSGIGDALINSGTTLATAATTGFMHIPHTSAAPTGTPTNTTPGCEWNTGSHTMNCYDGSSWYHQTFTSTAG